MKWHRSLYWRVALGVVAFLAAMLVVQAVLFIWAVSQSGRSLPGQSPARLGLTVALDLANVLERDPQADLARYVRDQYSKYTHPFFVLMSDGRLITSGSQSFPEPLLRIARERLERIEARPPRGFRGGDAPPGRPPGPLPGGRPDRFGDRFERGSDWFERDPTGFRFVRPSPILVSGQLVGIVVVPPQAPFGFLLGSYGPLLAIVAGGVLIVGTVLTSVMIFGPARRRLRSLEGAARRFGAGDLSARAPERGGDEIAAVASAFNTMADDLAASDRQRRQLLADVSHELNTPVTAMRGYLETLSMPELNLDESTKARYLSIITDETLRLERLIGDLLDLARLEGGGGDLRLDDVAVEQLFARVSARHERSCADAGITLTSTVGADADRVRGDRDRLEQALQNLAANALRFAPRGTSVRLTSARVDDSIVLSVEDEGPGIAPEHVAHIFDRFYKADAARADGSGGSGLGLSITKAIVERHQGRMAVDSRPGRTRFEIVLPAADSAGVGGQTAAV